MNLASHSPISVVLLRFSSAFSSEATGRGSVRWCSQYSRTWEEGERKRNEAVVSSAFEVSRGERERGRTDLLEDVGGDVGERDGLIGRISDIC